MTVTELIQILAELSEAGAAAAEVWLGEAAPRCVAAAEVWHGEATPLSDVGVDWDDPGGPRVLLWPARPAEGD